jgi:hypothetical protein
MIKDLPMCGTDLTIENSVLRKKILAFSMSVSMTINFSTESLQNIL